MRLSSAPLAILVLLAATACGTPLPTAGDDAVLPTTARVVLVSVDGLRGDVLSLMPRTSALAARGRSTDAMLGVTPSLTVPGHLSMLSGRDVTLLGIRDNAIDEEAARRMLFAGATSVFHWVNEAGGTSEAIAGAALLGDVVVGDAQRFFGVDTFHVTEQRAEAVADRAVARVRDRAPTLLFVHFPDADAAGHESGWIVPGVRSPAGTAAFSPAYLAAVARVDAAIGRLADALAPALDSGTVALVITADHGGGEGEGCVAGMPAHREHCTATPGDALVPFVLVARGVAPARIAPGTRLTQVGPTIGALLRARLPARADRTLGT